jgi:hypothetical protein
LIELATESKYQYMCADLREFEMKPMAAAVVHAPKVNCRTIEPADLDAVAKCLARGFPDTKIEYWRNGLRRLATRDAVDGFSKFGHCLEFGREIVGVLLQIYSKREMSGSVQIHCHLSSWCVDREYRIFAPALSLNATKRRDVTYINISPARHTRRGIEALGYRRYVLGEMLFIALLSRRVAKTSIVDFDDRAPVASLLPPEERELLREHRAMGRRAFVGLKDGLAFGFVSSPSRVWKGKLGCEQFLYFRDSETLVQFAGAIGAYFLGKGRLLFLVDANAPIEGLAGRHLAGRSPRYYRGPVAPRVGDLAYSELALLGESVEDGFSLGVRAPKWLSRYLAFIGLGGPTAGAPRPEEATSAASGNVVTVAFPRARSDASGVSPTREIPSARGPESVRAIAVESISAPAAQSGDEIATNFAEQQERRGQIDG